MILCLFGPSGSGKSTWKNYFISQGCFNDVQSITTRKRRINETHGIEYEFVTRREFMRLYNNEELFNTNLNYNHEMYGVRDRGIDLKKNYVIISDITSLKELRNHFGDNIVFIYCKPPQDIKERLIARGTPERVDISIQETKIIEEKMNELEFDVISLETIEEAQQIISKYKTT